MLSIATLEKIQPYQKEWLNDHDDTFTDIIHAIFNIALILTTAEILKFITQIFPLKIIWPTSLPLWLQLILVGLIIDFGLWYMHSLSHKHKWL